MNTGAARINTRSNLAINVGKTHRNKVAEILALISDLRDVMCIKGGSPQTKGKAMKVDLDKFMTEVHQLSGMTFNTFHTMFRYVNERNFGRTLYQQIKEGQITAQEVAAQLKAAM